MIDYTFTILEYLFVIKERHNFVKLVIVSYYIKNDYFSDFI